MVQEDSTGEVGGEGQLELARSHLSWNSAGQHPHRAQVVGLD